MSIFSRRPKASGSKAGSKLVVEDDLQKLPIAEVEKKLASSPDGLTEAEAQKRLTQYGSNEIAEKKTNEPSLHRDCALAAAEAPLSVGPLASRRSAMCSANIVTNARIK